MHPEFLIRPVESRLQPQEVQILHILEGLFNINQIAIGLYDMMKHRDLIILCHQ